MQEVGHSVAKQLVVDCGLVSPKRGQGVNKCGSVELYPHLCLEVLRKPYTGERTTSTLSHGSYHVLLPYKEISQVSRHKTSITLHYR